jgi:hypothetical protein
MLKSILCFAVVCWWSGLPAQNHPVSVVEFVKIQNEKTDEALYFYENNWKIYREKAVEKGFIRSFRLLRASSDSLAYDIVLITEYPDEKSHQNSEENFRSLISALRPKGPLLLNELKPADFRKSVSVQVMQTIFSEAN